MSEGGEYLIGGCGLPGRGVAGDDDGVGAVEGVEVVADREVEPVLGRDTGSAGTAHGEVVEVGPEIEVRSVTEDLQRAGEVEGDQTGQSRATTR